MWGKGLKGTHLLFMIYDLLLRIEKLEFTGEGGVFCVTPLRIMD
jgi:hypothetical protein